LIADKTYLVTRDGRLAPYGHPEGVTQIARAECYVEDDIAEKFGLPRPYDTEPHADPVMTAKAERPQSNKALRARQDKALKPAEDK